MQASSKKVGSLNMEFSNKELLSSVKKPNLLSSQKPISVSRKKPWNRTNPTIYSIASRNGERSNMNICSYVTPISMKPSRIVVGVYKNTLTLELVSLQNEMVLQLLSEDHYRLIKLLGQTSGYNKDKLSSIKSPLINYKGFQCLANSLALIHLKLISKTDAGDHWLMLCDVSSYINLTEGLPLTMDILRAKKLVRI
ncbi:MAG: flavin reductase [Flavitalea sp.]